MKQASPTAGSRAERGWDGEDGQEWADFSGEIRLLLQQLIQTLDGRNPPAAGEMEDKVILDLQVGECVASWSGSLWRPGVRTAR